MNHTYATIRDVADPRAGFVGRAVELSLLRNAFHDCERGRPQVVVVRGDAGIGKSRLVSEFTHGRTALVLRGRCPPQTSAGLGYAPILQAMRVLADSDEVLALPTAQRTALAPIFPLLEPPTDAPTRWAEVRLFEVLFTLLGRLGREQPVVLVLDDLHWADRGTIDFLQYLSTNLAYERVMVVGTHRGHEWDRPDWLGRALTLLTAEPVCTTIDLAPLSEDAALQLVDAHLDGSDAAPDILRRAAGNPLYLEQLAAASRAGATTELPPRLADLLSWRVASVSGPCRLLLEATSVVGTDAPTDLLEDLLDLEIDEFDAAVEEAMTNRLFVARGAQDCALSHALLGELVYHEIPPGRRARLHRRVAQALTERIGAAGDVADACSALARHWRLAGRPADAFAPLLAAARAARSRGLQHDAARMFTELLDLWPLVSASRDRGEVSYADLLGWHSDALRWTADPVDVLAAYERAVTAADLVGDGTQRASIRERCARALFDAGRGEDALAMAKHACELLADRRDALAARASAMVGAILMARGEYAESRLHCERALEIAEATEAPREAAHALRLLGVDLANLGELARAVVELQASLRICTENEFVEDQIHTHVNLAFVLEKAGRWREAVDSARTGRALCRAAGLEASLGALLVGNEVSALVAAGQWDEAVIAGDISSAPGSSAKSREYLDLVLAEVDVARGALARAAERLAVDYRTAEIAPIALARRRLVEALLASARRDFVDVHRIVHAAVDEIEHIEPDICLQLCRLGLAALAELDSAPGRLLLTASGRAATPEALLAIATRTAAGVADLPPCQLLLRLCRAEAGRGSADDADAWAELAHAFGALDQLYLRAYCLFRAGRFDEARRLADPLGAVLLGSDIAAAATLAGVPARSVAVEPPAAQRARQFGLTTRERQVVACLAAGSSNRQIARRLSITEKTASVHVSNILAKLHVRSRAEATAVIHQYALVQEDS